MTPSTRPLKERLKLAVVRQPEAVGRSTVYVGDSPGEGYEAVKLEMTHVAHFIGNVRCFCEFPSSHLGGKA